MTSSHSHRSLPLTSLSGHSAAHQLSLRPLQQKASPTRSNDLGHSVFSSVNGIGSSYPYFYLSLFLFSILDVRHVVDP